MGFTTSLWRVQGNALVELSRSRLDSENRLEEWIARDCSLLGLDLLIVGRQVRTEFGGRVDLLGIDVDANTVIVELKRDRTPRDVVAQAIDYASWAGGLAFDSLDALTQGHCGKGLAQAFSEHFDRPIPETVNASHSMIIVASELDDSSERIVEYLQDKAELAISVVFFNVFRLDGTEVVARAWSRDPESVTETAQRSKRPAWGGDWFVNIGNDPEDPATSRDWEECRRHGFVSAGGGRNWSDQLGRLPAGARVFAYAKGPQGERGYLGTGIVTTEKPVLARDFRVNGSHFLDLPLRSTWQSQRSADPDKAEYLVGIRWEKTFPAGEPRWFKGAFAKQHVACKLRDARTLDFLYREFGVDDARKPK